MKININIGKKLLAMMLAAVYIFAMSTYIVFLSSRTHIHRHHPVISSIQHIAANGETGNFYDKQHGAFKSVFPTKRRVINALLSIVCIAVLILPQKSLFPLRRHCVGAQAGLRYPGRPCYLSLRVFRI